MAIKTGNLFELAEIELQRENKKYTVIDVINYAVKIRKWIDKYGKKGNIMKQLDKKQWKKEANYKFKNKRG
jgi:hypothetical protein